MTDRTDDDHEEGTARQPRSARQSVFLGVTLERFGSSETTRHRVRDLSATGMRIDQASDLQPGATVLVSVGRLEAVAATIIWVKQGEAGVRFAAAIDPDQARGKAAVAPKGIANARRTTGDGTPSAGWIRDIDSPYRKR